MFQHYESPCSLVDNRSKTLGNFNSSFMQNAWMNARTSQAFGWENNLINLFNVFMRELHVARCETGMSNDMKAVAAPRQEIVTKEKRSRQDLRAVCTSMNSTTIQEQKYHHQPQKHYHHRHHHHHHQQQQKLTKTGRPKHRPKNTRAQQHKNGTENNKDHTSAKAPPTTPRTTCTTASVATNYHHKRQQQQQQPQRQAQ